MAKRTLSGERRPHFRVPNRIGLLLNEDWFLHKVLGYLVDDGLHECRRVCQKWNTVCKTLPVKLRWVPLEHVPHILTAFPNAVELSCSRRYPSENLDVARQLAGLTSLKHLDRLDYFVQGTRDDQHLVYAESYTRLQSLEVNLDSVLYESLRSVLLYLTGLKKLQILGGSKDDPSTRTPFTELKDLRELTLFGMQLKKTNGPILFPSTALTKLRTNAEDIKCALVLQDVVHYAATVRSLHLHLFRPLLLTPSWTALQHLSQLEVLEVTISGMGSPESICPIISNVKSISSLRKLFLETSGLGSRSKIKDDLLCPLTNLHSLSLTINALIQDRHAVQVSHLTKLTSLTLGGVLITGSIDPLNKLVYLSLDTLPASRGDPIVALMQMTKLKELVLRGHYPGHPPKRTLSYLTHLRRLDLTIREDINLDFFQSLALLSQLTSLHFRSISEQAGRADFGMQLILLTQLQKLRLECRSDFDILALFGEGTFPRLRYLEVNSRKLTDGEERMLFNRFPSLRSFRTLR